MTKLIVLAPGLALVVLAILGLIFSGDIARLWDRRAWDQGLPDTQLVPSARRDIAETPAVRRDPLDAKES